MLDGYGNKIDVQRGREMPTIWESLYRPLPQNRSMEKLIAMGAAKPEPPAKSYPAAVLTDEGNWHLYEGEWRKETAPTGDGINLEGGANLSPLVYRVPAKNPVLDLRSKR